MKKENAKERLTNKKVLLVGAALLIIAMVTALACAKFLGGEEPVKFEEIKESQIPKDITANIIPEYRTLERALACAIDDDIYVIVTRGEKPTSGFKVSVDRMELEEEKGKSNLIVYADFTDPEKKTAISQIITYPVQVVKTDLERLPDTIELRIQY
ncbi:MAG: protease complex subunit PrcB family protein [Bacillota bacterium]|nr:protease complex subunit PrcB family protein [Bacillota bacterium]